MVSRQETSRPLLTPGEVMQLPSSDELILISGLPPIRAKKLRYFEDANFGSRAIPAPTLSSSGYTDHPQARADDWTGLVVPAPAQASVSVPLGEDGSGGLQQARQPALAKPRRPKRVAHEQLDLLGLGDDDANPVVDAGAIALSGPLSPVVVADGVNQSSGRGGDLMPSF
jgi:type IV secretion system protein VirD4